VDLQKANLANANLSGARLSDSNLSNADLTNANFSDAILNRANFTSSILHSTNLSGARLYEAIFTGADFKDADLSNAEFRNTDISDAILVDTNLTGASVPSWVSKGAIFCRVTEPNGSLIKKDCNTLETRIAAKENKTTVTLTAINNKNASALQRRLPFNQDEVAYVQRLLNDLGFDAGTVDGIWGNKTSSALRNFLISQGKEFDGTLDLRELSLLMHAAIERDVISIPSVDWAYRATHIHFGGYENADEPPYNMIRTIRHIPDYGFNVITLNFFCAGKRDASLPDYYPLGRRLGCTVANKQILEEEGFASTRRDTISLAIDEARAAGLAVHLKPMFEIANLLGTPDADGENKVPLDVFFEGNGSFWSGYRDIIMAVAEYAQENGVEYLSIGTELNNINDKIENDPRWKQIIIDIRARFRGKLIYNHNFNRDSNLRDLPPQRVLRHVDIVGLNFFPQLLMDGRMDYTAEQVARAFSNAKTRQGLNMMKEAARLQSNLGVPIILSETHFPTWYGSANWIFRGSCDYVNKGRSGWQFTKGPRQAKIPSDNHGRILANGFMKAFEKQHWVTGADYLFWSVAWAYDVKTDTRQFGPCSSWIWDSNDGIRQMIAEFHKPNME